MLPTLADVLALEPVSRGAPRVLAGADRLGLPVRWVHVIELAEAGHLLRGGELVLSTGIALPSDPDGLARYVAGLAAAGVSALAVELGSRYLRELPRALVTAATVHGLPLIVLERETQFIAITEAVHAQILDAQVAELRAAQRLHEVFTGLAAAGAGQDEIVRQAGALSGAPVILADLAHRVLACAPGGHETAALLAGFAARSRAVAVPGRLGFDAAAGWLVATVGSPEGDWGRLVFALPGPPDAAARALAERAAATLELARLVSGRRQAPERATHGSLLAALARPGYTDLADVEARIVALGVPLAGRRLVPVVAEPFPAAGARAAADAMAAACGDLGVPAIAGTLPDGRAAALLAMVPGAGTDRLLARLADRLRRRGTLAPSGVLGTGPAAAGLAEARPALREAATAAAAAAACGAEPGEVPGRAATAGAAGGVVRLADLRLPGLLYQLRDDPRVLSFAERELGPLLLRDQTEGTGLLEVLAAYLAAGGNKARAAQQAGLARPTLYERLRQIEETLGLRLDAAESRLALHAALVVHQMRQPAGCT